MEFLSPLITLPRVAAHVQGVLDFRKPVEEMLIPQKRPGLFCRLLVQRYRQLALDLTQSPPLLPKLLENFCDDLHHEGRVREFRELGDIRELPRVILAGPGWIVGGGVKSYEI